MLTELVIEDLALIERATLTFGRGLNVITGETGAGKSLLIDALEFLLGRRARPGLVRQGTSAARVEGRFLVTSPHREKVLAWMVRQVPELADCESGQATEPAYCELILARTLSADGRSRAHVNHRPVTQRCLRDLSSLLVEIHGQNDHQGLLETAEQLQLLDAFGRLEGEWRVYAERRQEWLSLADRLEQLRLTATDRSERLEFLRFQLSELGTGIPTRAEFESLRSDREVLRHAESLGEQIASVLRDLVDSEPAALDALRGAERSLESWQDRVAEIGPPAAELREAVVRTSEAARMLRGFADRLELDPAKLTEIEQRLDHWNDLQRKYRTDIEGLAARRDQIAAELAQFGGSFESTGELLAACQQAQEHVAVAARVLTEARCAAAQRLERAVVSGLAELGLERARFHVAVREHQRATIDREHFSPHGASSVEFFLAANPGEPSQPLAQVASGGEVARIMLALRGALALRQTLPTLVFDEIDSGVGGRLAPRVGAHLRQLGGHHQVLCITHLPAIAALADQHTRVYKEVKHGRTRTCVVPLVGEGRVQEIADMIAGGAKHPTARAEARRLLGEHEAQAVA